MATGPVSARQASMPASSAIRATAANLSPDRSSVVTPNWRSIVSVSRASGRSRSAKANRTGERPGRESQSSERPSSLPASTPQNAADPNRMPCAFRPSPGNSTTPSIARAPGNARTSALDSGCRELRASPAAISSAPASGWLASSSRPKVSVPVLSNTTWSTFASRSSAVGDSSRSPDFMRRVPAMSCVTGTASARAQGQVMIRTAVAVTSA